MKNFGQALKAGTKGFIKGFEPSRYEAGGIQVRCTHCRGEVFQEQEARVNLDWFPSSGTALICENCGLIQWFGKKPERR